MAWQTNHQYWQNSRDAKGNSDRSALPPQDQSPSPNQSEPGGKGDPSDPIFYGPKANERSQDDNPDPNTLGERAMCFIVYNPAIPISRPIAGCNNIPGMAQNSSQLIYDETGAVHLETIRPLWEKLKGHHIELSPRFASLRRDKTFDDRKKEFLIKSLNGRFKLYRVFREPGGEPMAFCVASITSEGEAEIDSLFVDEAFRGQGIGTELMRRVLDWFEFQGPASRIVTVAHGNDDALRFYARFGFHPDNIRLRQAI
jgi:ribosomal protein S18 acetylase RimI-like enzyme